MSREGLDGYQLVQRIGSGGAGTVFVAEHRELSQPVAIKILHPHLVGDGSEQRMLAEAHALSLLDHPGIVKVLDMGVAADGRAYVVMERLVGERLDARMRRARLTEERTVTFARQLASALGAAHGAGVVHRDLKPENVLVVVDPELPGGERLKLIDFGIAKLQGQERTETGVVLGTPTYMAPEQFSGTRHVDPRADIYSLGVVIYLMATGTPPFAGRNTGELLAEHAFCRPVSASEIGGVSRRLSEIIERCLAKRPEERFATMGELDAALGALEAEAALGELEAEAALDALGAAPASASTLFDDATTAGFGEHDVTTTVEPPPGMFAAEPISQLISPAPVRVTAPTLPLPLPRPPSSPPRPPSSPPPPPLVPRPPVLPAPVRAAAEPHAAEPHAPEPPAAEPPAAEPHAPEPPARVARRSARGPLALIAAAGLAIALVHAWRTYDASGAIDAATSEVSDDASDADDNAIEPPALAPVRSAPAPRAEPAPPPRTREPAKVSRERPRKPATSRKPARERF